MDDSVPAARSDGAPLSRPAFEPQLGRTDRRRRGVYYTPPEIAAELVELTLGPLLACGTSGLRVLDPACGAGELLIATGRLLASRASQADAASRLFGIESDSAAAETARQRTGGCVAQADALFDRPFEDESFDAVLGNPPYMNIRQLAGSLPAQKVHALRERFTTARGHFDLYVPFIERALELLKAGGRCGLVVPNKWATLDYARRLRERLLREASIEHVVDLSSVRVFREAHVYPHLLVFTKRPPGCGHRLQFHANRKDAAPRLVPQASLTSSGIAFDQGPDIESRVKVAPLGEVCTISCGTAGYAAQRLARLLVEVEDAAEEPCWEFIASGNIDRYRIAPGRVRFVGRTYRRPVLPQCGSVSARQRQLFGGCKIVVAGMSQRLEAAWDDRGLALGVQVFALTTFQLEPQYLLALLNSTLFTYLFRTRFAAKCLSGGYLAINKGQLIRLPVALPDRTNARLVEKLGQLASGRDGATDQRDAAIDRVVYELYRLTAAEIDAVERHVAQAVRRAA